VLPKYGKVDTKATQQYVIVAQRGRVGQSRLSTAVAYFGSYAIVRLMGY
jgi:hypothetical protein